MYTCRKIDISTATLTYDVENLSKNQFEIMSEGKVTSIQASSNEIMVYWLTALQVHIYVWSVCVCGGGGVGGGGRGR